MTPFDFTPYDYQFFWPNRHYTYPAVTLLTFALVSGIWASIVFAKFVFTFIDCANAWLIYRLSSDRTIVLLYLCHPVGIWFVSHEGQFESVVNFFSLLALFCLKQRKPVCWFFLATAVQTKFFPLFLAPYFLYTLRKETPKFWFKSVGWGLLGCLPSILALVFSRYLAHLFQPGYVPSTNPMTWALFDTGLHAFNPFWLVLYHWVGSLFFLLVLFYFMKREQRAVPYFAPLVFLVFVKMIPLAHHWYMLMLPVMCLTVERPSHRRVLFVLTMMLGIRSILSITIGPIGYCNPPTVMNVLHACMFGL